MCVYVCENLHFINAIITIRDCVIKIKKFFFFFFFFFFFLLILELLCVCMCVCVCVCVNLQKLYFINVIITICD